MKRRHQLGSYMRLMEKLPEGYRLETEEDRKKPKPSKSKFFTGNGWANSYDTRWLEFTYAVPTN